jgi:hypothetical protein
VVEEIDHGLAGPLSFFDEDQELNDLRILTTLVEPPDQLRPLFVTRREGAEQGTATGRPERLEQSLGFWPFHG